MMGRPRRFKKAQDLAEEWERYKARCNDVPVVCHDFSAKNSQFVSAELRKSVTYTIEGFCVFAGIPRATFYEIYASKNEFQDIVARIKEECEVDAREKFELGVIPTQLAALWMGRHGYTAKTESKVEGAVPVVLAGADALED
ncbi:MAG: DNA-packaging protein [Clostridiales bacterium]|jgi:hypothetical protein|nr:DNA-packaging protein [Clostridiales bacterium]